MKDWFRGYVSCEICVTVFLKHGDRLLETPSFEKW